MNVYRLIVTLSLSVYLNDSTDKCESTLRLHVSCTQSSANEHLCCC